MGILNNSQKRSIKTSSIIKAALIAALYVAATFAFQFMSFGVVQFRISEVLVALVFFEPAAAPGLLLGCFISNLLGPGAFYDAVIGSLASLLGLLVIKIVDKRGKSPLLGLILYTQINALIIALELTFISGLTGAPGGSYLSVYLWLLLGETVTATCGAYALYHILKKRWKDIVGETKKSEE